MQARVVHLPKILYVKLTYCDNSNKNVEHLDLRITKICATFTTFSQ